MEIECEGYRFYGSFDCGEISIIFPTLNLVFGMGISRTALLHGGDLIIAITNFDPDYMSALCYYVVHRERNGVTNPPTIIVPIDQKDDFSSQFDINREIYNMELRINLIGMAIGEEFQLREGLILSAFKTTNVIRDNRSGNGYIVYSVEQQLKLEYKTLPESEIQKLESSGVETKFTMKIPEIAFTGKTKSDFIVDPNNADALWARILLLECKHHPSDTLEDTRSSGDTHFSEIVDHADQFGNRAILVYNLYNPSEMKGNYFYAMPPSLALRLIFVSEFLP